jgi:hypothetical protein
MRSIKFLGFAAGVVLAASSTVVAQTGPTFPTTPPVTVDGSTGDTTVGSGSSVDPRTSVDPGKLRTGRPEGIGAILPGTDPAAGR